MRVCGMASLLWRRLLQPCLLVLMAVVPTITSRGDNCPMDVQQSTNECLVTYSSHVSALGTFNFYTGIDVENIRSICRSLSQSIRCVVQLKQSCPENSHSKIMTAVDGPLINVAELCHVENLYEIYSRHQFCYSRVQSASESCSETFDDQISHIRDRLSANDQQAKKEYCRHFDVLVVCIKSNLQRNCGSEAATLTEKLVRASYGQSEQCQDEVTTTSTHKTTTAGAAGRTGGEGGLQGAPASSSSTSRLSVLVAVVVLASTFIINVAPLH